MASNFDDNDSLQMPLSVAQREELKRRLETLESDIEDGVSWEQLKAELAARTA